VGGDHDGNAFGGILQYGKSRFGSQHVQPICIDDKRTGSFLHEMDKDFAVSYGVADTAAR
jgi:hypothetical protein